jgi:hypothetical protein
MFLVRSFPSPVREPELTKWDDSVNIKVASSRWSGVRLGGRTRLPGGLQDADDTNSIADEDLEEEEERGDELPTSLPPSRPSLSQRSFKILEILGWTGDRRKGGTVWGGKDGGVARAFWGIRKKDRVGGIRLGDEEDPRSSTSPRGVRGGTGRIERVQTGGNYTSAAPSSPRSPRASASPKLFDLGEEEEEERRLGEADAVELAMDFALPGDPLRGGGQSVPARGMQRVG